MNNHYDIVQPNRKLLEVHKRTGLGLRPRLNISVVFGMSAPSFVPYAYTSYGIEYTQEQAKEVRENYFKLYPEFRVHHSHIWNSYKDKGFTVQTALGRRVKPRLGTDGINIPVQGSGAETTKLAVHYLVKDYGEEALKYIYNVIHDSCYLRVPSKDKEVVEYWANALNNSMLKAWTEIGKTSAFKFKDIPMINEVEINTMDGTKHLKDGKIQW